MSERNSDVSTEIEAGVSFSAVLKRLPARVFVAREPTSFVSSTTNGLSSIGCWSRGAVDGAGAVCATNEAKQTLSANNAYNRRREGTGVFMGAHDSRFLVLDRHSGELNRLHRGLTALPVF